MPYFWRRLIPQTAHDSQLWGGYRLALQDEIPYLRRIVSQKEQRTQKVPFPEVPLECPECAGKHEVPA